MGHLRITRGILLVFLALVAIALFKSCDAQGFAAMSVDFGSKFIKIGIVKPGIPLEIVLNKESRRKTPNLVYIRNGERGFGDPAQALAVRFPQNVYGNLNDLVAKNLDHPIVQQYMKNYPHIKLAAHENRSTVVVPIDDVSYSVETLLAMILSNAKEAAEAFADQNVKDVVVTVPVFFNQAERKAIVDAAKIAKLNLLQLINDGTAAALNYGVFRRKEVSEKPQRLMIYDMGASKTTATIVEYKLLKEKYSKEPLLTILGVGFDRTLGGEIKTLRVRDLLIEKFRANYKTETDITTNMRGMAKIYKEAERVKQVLSANVDHLAQIESVHEEKDMRVRITRDELNKLIADLEERMIVPVNDALTMAGLSIDQVDQVVLMGAGTRVPKVQEVLQKAIKGKELGRFLNTDEAIAMGALYQAAHLSKGFKVKTFHINDLQLYPIQVNFISKQKIDGTDDVVEKPIQRTLFGFKSAYPSGKKVITFTSYTDDFSFDLNYGDLSHLSEKQKSEIGSTQISQVFVAGLQKALEEKHRIEETEFKGVKAAFIIDGSGLIRLEGADAVIERKPKGVVESNNIPNSVFESLTNTISGFFSGEGKKEEGEPSDEKTDGEGETRNGDDQAEQKEREQEETLETKESKEEKKEGLSDDATKNEEKNADINKKKKKNETDVPAIVKVKLSLSQKHLDASPVGTEERKSSSMILEKFEKEERSRNERQAAENELESFAFEASLLSDEKEFIDYSNEGEREKLSKEANRVRAWLEEDTNPSTPTVNFTSNLKKIKEIVTPVKKRIQEAKNRPAAVEELMKSIESAQHIIKMSTNGTVPLKAVQDENEVFEKKINAIKVWLAEKISVQEKTPINENPVLQTEEISVKGDVLRRTVQTYIKKMSKIADDEIKAKKKAEREEKKRKEKKENDSKTEGGSTGKNAENKSSDDGKSSEEPVRDQQEVEMDKKNNKEKEETANEKTEL